jgi:nucleoside-diphosphate-sugar epimerase
VIPTVVSQLAAGAHTIKLGALDPTRDFLYVKDTAAAFVAVGTAPASAVEGEVFNAGTGEEVSVGQLAADIARLMDVEVAITEDAQRIRPKNSEVMRLVADASRLRERTDWQPAYTRDHGLIETIDWFRRPTNLARYKPGIYNQ